MYVLSAESMKKAEIDANKSGLSFCEMMTRAGCLCAERIFERVSGRQRPRGFAAAPKVAILIGKGRNGGDGYVIARRLYRLGIRDVTAILVFGESDDELCVKMQNELEKYPVDILDFRGNPDGCLEHIKRSGVIVEAIFGIGFKGRLTGAALTVVNAANENENAMKFAVDVPAGLPGSGIYDSEDEEESNPYFYTDETLSMICLKPVHALMPTAARCSKTTVIDIGVDRRFVAPYAENYTVLTDSEAIEKLNTRRYDANKGDFGRILTIAGSGRMVGCVYFLNKAAAEIGAGLITAAYPKCIGAAVTAKLSEPVFLPLECDGNGFISADYEKELSDCVSKSDVVAIGCGIGVTEKTTELTCRIIKEFGGVSVIDADGINCVSANINVLKEAKGKLILTPHPGEMSRLTGLTIDEIQSDRVGAAKRFAGEYGATLLLKGANTVVASPDGRIYVNTTGNPGMARGGSGDVLTGVIAGLIGQTSDVFDAACLAAYIHGGAADMLRDEYCVLSATPTRVAESLHRFVARLSRRNG